MPSTWVPSTLISSTRMPIPWMPITWVLCTWMPSVCYFVRIPSPEFVVYKSQVCI